MSGHEYSSLPGGQAEAIGHEQTNDASTSTPGATAESSGDIGLEMHAEEAGGGSTYEVPSSLTNAFSSASMYAPLDGGQRGSASGASALGLATPPSRIGMSRPLSYASSHMLGGGSDYDSTYRLNEHGRSGRDSSYGDALAMGGYEKGSWTPDAEAPGSAAYVDAATKRPGLDRYGRSGTVPHKKRWLILAGVVAVLALLVIAIVVPITQILLKDDNSAGSKSDEAGTTQTDSSGHGVGGKVLTSGTNGSVIDLGNGQSFTYINSE